MAQIIPFPGTTAEVVAPPAAPIAEQPAPTFSKVTKIRRWGRMPKANRPEDERTIMLAGIARLWGEKAYALAQTEPNSERHRLAVHMTKTNRKLPRNNLRIFTTPEDVVQGLYQAWRRVNIANLEWQLCDQRRFDAACQNDDTQAEYWSAQQGKAEDRLWLEYERLIRIPAPSLSAISSRKLGRWSLGVGDLKWMRTHKPEFAVILDDETARLTAEKEAAKADRAAKKERGTGTEAGR